MTTTNETEKKAGIRNSDFGTEAEGPRVIYGARIRLSNQQLFCLAEVFADEIHGAVVAMHLHVIAEGPNDPSFDFRARVRIAEVCAAVRSMDGLDRKTFVRHIRYHFHALRTKRGTDVRWQEYRARVLACRAERKENERSLAELIEKRKAVAA